jgi:hypothetical protein
MPTLALIMDMNTGPPHIKYCFIVVLLTMLSLSLTSKSLKVVSSKSPLIMLISIFVELPVSQKSK